MEAYFNQLYPIGNKPGPYAPTANDAAVMHAFGMEPVGPPIALD
jgi:hypothetical protein